MLKPFRIVLSFLFLFLLTEKIHAQDFLNGDFEINTSSPCNYNLGNAVFDATMANVNAYGGGGELDIMGPFGACPYGNPQNGNWFVGLAFPSTSDAFTMTLCSPLIAGTTYTMEFWDKGDSQYPPSMPIIIGVSTLPGVSGTTVYTGPVPTIDVWTLRSFTFVAPNNGMYISVEAAGPTRWTHVDNFKIINNSSNTVTTSPITGSPYCACSTVNVSFTSTGTFNAGNTYTALLSDASGSFAGATTIGTLASTANSGTIVCTIPCNAVAGSSYLIQVTSSNPGTICSIGSANITIGAGTGVAVNSPTICPGETATLIATGGTTYTWSAGVTNVGADTANAAPLVTTTYTVTGTGASCLDTAVATVTVVANLNMLVNSPTICAGETTTLTASGGTTYAWSAGVTNVGADTANAAPLITTTYTVTGTTGTCTGTAAATVTVNPLPVVTVNSPTICLGQTANLSAGGATTYTWSAGATATGANTADASPATTTSYTVVGTTGTCVDSAVATVTISAPPTITVNSVTICAGQTANLVAGGGTTYSWSAGATSTGVNTANATPIVTTTYTVTGTVNGCTNTAVATVTVSAGLSVTVNSPSICEGQTANLSAGGGTTYTWSAGATSTGVNTADASPATTTSYTVTGTSGTCTGTAVSTVTVNPIPVITVNTPNICNGQTATLTANGATTYTWSAGLTPTGVNTATTAPTTTSFYTVTGTTNGCSGTVSASVIVHDCIPPVANFSGTPLTICNSGCVDFIDLSTEIPSTWNWQFPGGVPATASGQGPFHVCYTAVGQYTVILAVSNNEGSDTLIRTNYVNIVSPVQVNITGDLSINACDPAYLLAMPPGNTYSWGPNAFLSCSNCEQATVTPPATQQYYVEYTDVNGCYSTDTATVTVTPLYTYFMPTGFSPNGDGVNDKLIVQGRGIDFIQLNIFDRVGEKVFETANLEQGWDGSFLGVPMNSGTFVYTLEVTYCNGEVVREHGSVMMVR